jgi:hypothetical protein
LAGVTAATFTNIVIKKKNGIVVHKNPGGQLCDVACPSGCGKSRALGSMGQAALDCFIMSGGKQTMSPTSNAFVMAYAEGPTTLVDLEGTGTYT